MTSERILSIFFINLLLISSLLAALPAAKAEGEMVAYWSFDEGSGTTASDSSGNENTGTLNGAQWVEGVSGTAVKFNGVNAYVRIPHSASLDISGNEISVEFWIKFENGWYAGAGTYDQIIYDKGDAYTAAMIASSGAHRFNIPYVPPYPETNKNTWDANSWYHIANVFDGNQIKIYINGVLDKTETVVGSVSRSTINLAIGSHCYGGKNFFEGTIDEFAIYNYARTTEQIWNDWIEHAPIEEPSKYAVIIGIDDYNNVGTTPSIVRFFEHGPVKSANDMFNVLVDMYSFPVDDDGNLRDDEHTRLLIDEQGKSQDDITAMTILDQINWLQINVKPNDIAVFYYAGHGGVSGDFECLVPNDQEVIWDFTFTEEINKIKSDNLVIILDSSFSGGFITDGQTWREGVNGIINEWTDLANDTPSGRIVLTACAENPRGNRWQEWLTRAPYHDTKAWYFGHLNWEMVFTHYLVEGFRGKGDANHDGNISVEEAFDYAQSKILIPLYRWLPIQHPLIYDGYPSYGTNEEFHLGDAT